ncbi:DNA repair photolyase [Haloferula luteola]|uniref:DNA repair photolyase n=1 Tax=Haloferula luteola TaxID=595692 RepID=A0A840VES2_9BACT|nr:PA0069 family radical SAM protein [Haloferula luteola]MBB5351321.1 DNA repair photolyase [Haloferula luteola]
MNSIRGRGAQGNPANRFQALQVEVDEDAWVDEDSRPLRTEFLRDDSQEILARNSAEDLSFDYGVNPYRGCEHGCSYCYARTYHEYLGYSAGLDFESRIVVKPEAPRLLAEALARPGYRLGKISMSGVTDCYQPIERTLKLTRGCLEVMATFRQPVVLITKNALVTRDLDALRELSRWQAVAVYLSVTTLDPALARVLEPRASTPRARLEALEQLSAAGVACGVSAAPMIPGLNDHELPEILKAVKEVGGSFAAYSMVRLPGAVAEVFGDWLDHHRPGAKEKVLGRIRDAHGGRLNRNTPGERMRGTGPVAEQLRALFHASCRRLGLATTAPEVKGDHFRRCLPDQGELF